MIEKVLSWFRGEDDSLANSIKRMKQQDAEMKKAGETLELCSKKVRDRTHSLKVSLYEPQQHPAPAQLTK